MELKPDRRSVLLGLVAGSPLFAGCAEGDSNDSTIQDSDGDGVIDSEDYAPRDPEVQEREDVVNTDTLTQTPEPTQTPTRTSTPTQTSTQTPSPTPTPTPTPSPTEPPETDQLVVDDEYWADTSHITSYGPRSAHITIDPEFPETDFDAAKAYLGLFEFPDEGIFDETTGPPFNRSEGRQSFTLSVDPDAIDTNAAYYYLAGLLPDDVSEGNIDYTLLTSVMETDPFRYGSARRNISRMNYENELTDDSGSSHTRNNIEGAYNLEVSGRTSGHPWAVDFFGYKSAHASARRRSRGRSRSEYVNYELTEGTAEELANLLKNDAESLGFSDFEAVEFVIDFVQALPYVPDDVSRGFDDYTKFIMETVPEMAGDCEDTAILLASILQSEPFNYDMILIQPPGHMAAGMWNSDPTGYYWELDGRTYEYIETTGRGWGIGDCPEEYRDTEAYLHQV